MFNPAFGDQEVKLQKGSFAPQSLTERVMLFLQERIAQNPIALAEFLEYCRCNQPYSVDSRLMYLLFTEEFIDQQGGSTQLCARLFSVCSAAISSYLISTRPSIHLGRSNRWPKPIFLPARGSNYPGSY